MSQEFDQRLFSTDVVKPKEHEVFYVPIEDIFSIAYLRPNSERTGRYSLSYNQDFLHPETGEIFELKTSRDKGAVFHNGIKNSFADFQESMCYLGTMSTYNIQGVHSASFGIAPDVFCYATAFLHHMAYEGVRELHKTWHDFFANCSAQATFLTICHSRGVVNVRNALLSFPPHLRERIEVIAIAPGAYIDSYLCKRVRHYESTRDIVPHIDILGQRCRSTIVTLQAHPKAGLLDHSFMSKTYERALRRDIENYNNQ